MTSDGKQASDVVGHGSINADEKEPGEGDTLMADSEKGLVKLSSV